MYSYIEAAEADNTASFSRPICIKWNCMFLPLIYRKGGLGKTKNSVKILEIIRAYVSEQSVQFGKEISEICMWMCVNIQM